MKKKYKSPSEIVTALAGTKDLIVIYMELVKYGYSGSVAAEVLKLIIQGKDIVDFLKKQRRPIPVQ